MRLLTAMKQSLYRQLGSDASISLPSSLLRICAHNLQQRGFSLENQLGRHCVTNRQNVRPAEPANAIPVSWVRVDPQSELLARIRVVQPEGFWIAQLEFSKDAVAQAAAVAGLAALRPFSYKGMNALFGCLENSRVFCR